LVGLSAIAAESTSSAAAGGEGSTATALATPFGKLTIGGDFDLYYAHNFNGAADFAGQIPNGGPIGANTPPVVTLFHKFDGFNNQFSLNLMEVRLELEGSETDCHVDLDYGQSGEFLHVFSTGGSIDDVSKYIGQAYVTYHPTELRGFSLSAGKMDSDVALESFRSRLNPNYSHSFLYSLGLPYWQTGVRLGYQIIPGRIAAAVSVSNGFNTFYAVNGAKSYGVHLGFVPFGGLQIYYNGAFGPQAIGTTAYKTSINDIHLSYAAAEEFFVMADVLFGDGSGLLRADGSTGSASWRTAWLAWQIGFPGFDVVPRLEFFRDINGSQTGTDQMLVAETVTARVKLADSLQGRLEFRHDGSDHGVFVASDGTLSQGQNTFTVALLYWF
jgi:hypothetical protein